MSKRSFHWLLALLTLAGAGLRLVQLDSTLGLDETVTAARFVQGGLGALFADYGGYGNSNNHVLNSLLAYASTRAFGLEIWALRLPSFVAGVLLIPLVGKTVESLLGDRLTAAVAAFLVTFSGILIAYSAACRGYALLLFFALLSTLLILRVVEHGERGKLPLLVLALFATGWSHMTGLVFVGTGGLLVVLSLAFERRSAAPADPLAPGRRSAVQALAAIGLAALALVLWYSRGSFILQDVTQRVLGGEFVDPSLANVGSLHKEGGLLPWIEHTGKKFFGTSGPLLVVCLPLALAGIPLALRRDRRSGAILTCLVLFPPAALLVGRLRLFPRYFLFVQPFVLVLVAVTLTTLGRALAARAQRTLLRQAALASFALALVFQGLSLPLLRDGLTAPGPMFMGIDWDVKGAVDWLAARIGPDDVVLAFPFPGLQASSRERHFPHSFEYHAETVLAPILSRPSTAETGRRRVWYVTPQPVIQDLDPLPLGFEPSLAVELRGCSIFQGDRALEGWRPVAVPAFAAQDGAPGWTLHAPFENVSLRLEETGPQHAPRVALLPGESGADGELVSRPLPVTGGTLVELRTEVETEQPGGMRPVARLGFHFYDASGERVASVMRTALPWDDLRPHPGASFLRLATCAPRSATTMELVLGLAFGNHAGDVVRFRRPTLYTEHD